MSAKSSLWFCGLFVLFLMHAGSARAADRAWADCAGRDTDRRISGCTAVLARDAKESTNTQATAYNNRAAAYYDKGDYDRATADYDAALRIDPKNANAYNNRKLVYEANDDCAIVDEDAALWMDPNHVNAYFIRGVASEAKGDLTAALDDIKTFRRLSPHGLYAPAAQARLEREIADATQQKIVAAAPPEAAVPPSASAAPQPAAPAEKRVALVIGNADYTAVGLLPNPQNDAEAIGRRLKAAGFEVTQTADPTHEQFNSALAGFATASETADWAVVYYAGHGIEMAGINYLIPVDATLATDTTVRFEAVSIDQVMAVVEGAHKLRLVIFDACRAHPFASQMRLSTASRPPKRGFVRPPEPDVGELLVYAAKDGEQAEDGGTGNSPFADAPVEEGQKSSVEIRRLFDRVRDDVIAATGGHQHPFTYGSLSGSQDFFLSPK